MSAESPSIEVEEAPEQEEEKEETIEVDRKVLETYQRSVKECSETIDSIKSEYGETVKGDSSFLDITMNLLTAMKGNLRTLERFQFKRAYDVLVDDMPLLKGYLAMIQEDISFREQEFEHEGAYPDIRKEADALKSQGVIRSSIKYYLRKIFDVNEQE
jgi:hypothetical protein